MSEDKDKSHQHLNHELFGESPNFTDSRRSFVKVLAFSGLVAVFSKGILSLVKKDEIVKSDHVLHPEELSDKQIEHLMDDPISLKLLDGLGTLNFIDSVQSIARDDYSMAHLAIKFFAQKSGLSNLTSKFSDKFPSKDFSVNSKFPAPNMGVGLALNTVRCMYGHEAKHHTVEELKTTVIGVGLLAALTSVAKGIVATEKELFHESGHEKPYIQENPEKVIADSIFNTTFLATATQLPLTAFGNASKAKSEFAEIKEACQVMYGNLPENRKELESCIEQDNINDKVRENVKKLLRKNASLDGKELREELNKMAQNHKNDLMAILMSTACDDSQAALGDAGPLVGLYQSFGPDFLKIVPATLPYTLLIALDRSALACKRAGISYSEMFTKRRWAYFSQFIKNTWKNLGKFFIYAAPEVVAKVGNKKINKIYKGNGKGFDMETSLANDIDNIVCSVGDLIQGSFHGDNFDINKFKKALQGMASFEETVDKVIGRSVSKDPDNIPERQRVRESLNDFTEQEKLDNPNFAKAHKNLNDYLKEDEELEKQLDVFKTALGDNVEVVLNELNSIFEAREREGKGKPKSINDMANLLRENPTILKIFDFDYCHEKLGPELTDTIWVVTLQGMHLVFLINTFDRLIYKAEWFKKLPLAAQEVFSGIFNDFVSMFADNWADCVAHSKWLTGMYFNDLDSNYLSELGDIVGKDKIKKLTSHFFEDNSTSLIPNRFGERKNQFSSLVFHLSETDSSLDKNSAEDVLRRYFETSERHYYTAMSMSLIHAVTGGGKALTGNAPHFTAAADQKDFNLITSLEDFKNHPLYHVWELIFSTAYSIKIGPKIAQGLFGNNMDKLAKEAMQGSFKKKYPDFEKKLEELREKDSHVKNKSKEKSLFVDNAKGFFNRRSKNIMDGRV